MALNLTFLAVWLVTLASAMAVVHTTYSSRQSLQALEGLREQASAMRVEAGKYQLERSALASLTRVESIAHGKLDMVSPPAPETVLIIRE